MRKAVSILFALALCLSLCACGGTSPHGTKDLKSALKHAEVGDYVVFGTYEQDNDYYNGKEGIEWIVLDIKDDKALLVSKYVLDRKPYNSEKYADVTWETCSLREWLNNDFINDAFSADEQAMIPTITVSADENPSYSTNPGNATQDQVFLLSITDCFNYGLIRAEPTDYAITEGSYVIASGHSPWWLRSPGLHQDFAANFLSDGRVNNDGIFAYDPGGVRPALWIDWRS